LAQASAVLLGVGLEQLLHGAQLETAGEDQGALRGARPAAIADGGTPTIPPIRCDSFVVSKERIGRGGR